MSREKIRIAMFDSFYRGFYVLEELLHGHFKDQFLVVGLATDDVTQPFISRNLRVWQYPKKKIRVRSFIIIFSEDETAQLSPRFTGRASLTIC